MTKSRGIRPPRHYWTDSEIEQIERLYPDTPTAEIARQLGMTTSRVSVKAARLGLKKSAACPCKACARTSTRPRVTAPAAPAAPASTSGMVTSGLATMDLQAA